MANPNEERTNAFGIPWRPPDRDQGVAQYLNRSIHKLRIAKWHLAEFEQLAACCINPKCASSNAICWGKARF